MNHFVRKAVLLVSCLLLPGLVFAWPLSLPKKNIELNFDSGHVPLTVRIIGPQELALLGRGYPEKFDWCEYRVSWGDGANTDFYKEYKQGLPQRYCTSGLEHVYQKPGTFSIKVIKFHPGNANGIINDWVGRTKVIVNNQ
jgi:hypothetical protein